MTVNQRNFARLAAQGKRLVDAHEIAYGKGNGKRKTKVIEASKLAARPEVKAAIAEYEAEYARTLCPIEDWRQVRLEMLNNIRLLAVAAKDERVRYSASTYLQGYADEREKQEEQRRNRQPITLDGLIHEIRQLDAPAETVEMEAVEETPGEPAPLTGAAPPVPAAPEDD